MPEQPDIEQREPEKETDKNCFGLTVNFRYQKSCANMLSCPHSGAIRAGCGAEIKAFPSHTEIHQQKAESSLAQRT